MTRALAILAALACALVLVDPAQAAGGGKPSSGGGGSNRIVATFSLEPEAEAAEAAPEAESEAEAARSVDMPTLAVPVFVDGYLQNYLFVSVRLEVADGVDVWRTRERTHQLRDAMIRATHAASIGKPDDPTELDAERARAVLLAAAETVMPQGQFARVEIIHYDSMARARH